MGYSGSLSRPVPKYVSQEGTGIGHWRCVDGGEEMGEGRGMDRADTWDIRSSRARCPLIYKEYSELELLGAYSLWSP